MGLITVEELRKAMGVEFTPSDADQAQYYIDFVSAAIESYTGKTFSPVEDATLRMQADYYGFIDLSMNPISLVSLVAPVADNIVCAYWDGLQTIYNLQPHGVYDVTLSYGYASTPVDIKGAVTEICKQAMNNPDGQQQFRVGDVTEIYATDETTIERFTMPSLTKLTIDSYKDRYTTWRMGPRAFPCTGIAVGNADA